MKKLLLTSTTLTICFFAFAEILNDSGKTNTTGAPNEGTCIDCHSGTSASASITLSSNNLSNWVYTPGQTYDLSLTISNTGSSVFGLDVEALNSSNADAGTLIASNATETKTVKTNRSNLTHKLNGGLATDTKTFNFQWKAPATDIGNITFYFAGIAGNNSGSFDSGDIGLSGNQVVSSSTTSLKNSNKSSFVIAPSIIENREFFIHLKNQNTSTVFVEIINTKGEIVQSENLHSSTNNVSGVHLNNEIANGIYFVKVTNGSDAQIQKIIVQ